MSLLALTFKCDRDGTEAEGITTGGGTLPPGWIVLNGGGADVVPITMQLCPACAEAFATFVGTTLQRDPRAAKPEVT